MDIKLFSISLVSAIIYLMVLAHSGSTRICQKLYLYLNHTGKCYPSLAQGPCGEMSVVTLHEQDDGITGLGKCDCRPRKICHFDRPRIYMDSRCYSVYDQGACADGEWLVPTSNASAICAEIPCLDEYKKLHMSKPSKPTDKTFLFPFEGKCYQNLQEGFPRTRVYIGGQADHFKFWCLTNPEEFCYFVHAGVLVNAPKLCSNGSLADRYGGCNPVGIF